jgi:hypothetical protein
MAAQRLSALQRRILAWLLAHEQRYQGTMAASYTALVQALGRGSLILREAMLVRADRVLLKVKALPAQMALVRLGQIAPPELLVLLRERVGDVQTEIFSV